MDYSARTSQTAQLRRLMTGRCHCHHLSVGKDARLKYLLAGGREHSLRIAQPPYLAIHINSSGMAPISFRSVSFETAIGRRHQTVRWELADAASDEADLVPRH